jgi:hypothetical protein
LKKLNEVISLAKKIGIIMKKNIIFTALAAFVIGGIVGVVSQTKFKPLPQNAPVEDSGYGEYQPEQSYNPYLHN